MSKPDLTIQSIKKAFEMLGYRIGGYDDIELLVVGGVAGKLGNYVGNARVTADCDVMVYDPESAVGQVEQEAFQVGKELGLPKEWLNHLSHAFAHYLPDDWKSRRHLLGHFGLLHVYYLDRYDFLALKTLAGRDVDLKDLLEAKPTREEVTRLKKHIDALLKIGRIDAGRASDSLILLEGLEAR